VSGRRGLGMGMGIGKKGEWSVVSGGGGEEDISIDKEKYKERMIGVGV
jgi:hypothetical protein